MQRSEFELMLETAIQEAANFILQGDARKAKKPSSVTQQILSQHPITDNQRHAASVLASTANCRSGEKITLQSSDDLPPCF